MGGGANPTAGVTGFGGNSDLYGIGIRIGYYTAALSIWISNLWAPAEVYFIRPVTLTFLVSLLIGVSVLSGDPGTTHAIEPFMMMQIAYDTYNMGLYAPPEPELLAWERKYFTIFTTAIIGMGLHGYDTWYWWVGKDKMLKTPGDGTTVGFFIYFGQLDLFSWVEWPMRAFLAAVLLVITLLIMFSIATRTLQKKMDYLVTPDRLEELANRWLANLGIIPGHDNGLQRGVLLSPLPAIISRNPSSASKRSSKSAAAISSSPFSADDSEMIDASPTSSVDAEKSTVDIDEKFSINNRTIASQQNPPFMATIQRSTTIESDPKPITRTMSERIRYHVLGWTPEPPSSLPVTHYPSMIPSPQSYTPSLETIIAATDILEAANFCKSSPTQIKYWAIPLLPFITMWIGFKCMYEAVFASIQLIPPIFKYGIRPGFLLAVCFHGNSLRWNRSVSYPRLLLRVVKHPLYSSSGLNAYDISLASRIMLSLKPLGKPNRTLVLFWAYLNFSLCSMLVIGTELAIQWNKIENVQTLTSVGQLIPAAIGVGGLLKVLYTALIEKDAEIDLCFGRCRGILRKARWKEASESYKKAATEWQRRREVESLDDREKRQSKGEKMREKSFKF